MGEASFPKWYGISMAEKRASIQNNCDEAKNVKNMIKFPLTKGRNADKLIEQNKEGWKHPPHPQQGERVKMV